MRRYASIALLLVVLSTIGQGCGQDLSLPVPDVPEEEERPPAIEPTESHETALYEIEPITLKRRWTKTFRGVASCSISPDGSSAVVSGVLGRRKRFGVYAYDPRGELLWESVFADRGLKGGGAEVLGAGRLVAATAWRYEDGGRFWLLDGSGTCLWTTPIKGGVTAVASGSAARVALLDYGRGFVTLYTCSGKPIQRYDVGSDARIRFVAGLDYLLVVDQSSLVLIDDQGKFLWNEDLSGTRLCDVRVAGDGALLAAATGGPDSRLYMFDRNGQPLWQSSLVPGGTNDLLFSPDRRQVVAFNVGPRSSVCAFDAASGEMLWRRFIEAPGDDGVHFRSIRYAPDGRSLVADLVELRTDEGAVREVHHVVAIGSDGSPLWRASIGSNVEVDLAGDCCSLVVTSRPTGSSRYPETRVEYYDMRFLYSSAR